MIVQDAIPGAIGFVELPRGDANAGTTYHIMTLADSGAGSFMSRHRFISLKEFF